MDLILLEDTTIIDAATLQAAGINIAIAEVLIPIFFAFSVLYDMLLRALGSVDGDAPSYFSKRELVRVGALMAMAGPLYIAIFWPLSTVVHRIATVTEPSFAEVTTAKQDLIAPFSPNSATTATPDVPWWDTITDSVKKGVTIARNTIYLAFSAPLIAMILAVISTAVKLFALLLARIFFILGPLAVAFSMLPVFKDKLSQWFGVYLNCLFVPITLNGLDFLYYSTIHEALRGTTEINPLVDTVFQVVMIIVYCLSFWLTSFYVGSSSAGRVLSTAATAATSLVGYLAGSAATASRTIPASGGNIIEDASSVTSSQRS
jgi:hypothetical protein